MELLPKETQATLKVARAHYGYRNQILVAVEELNELACVLTKYPRYNSHDKAVRELREHVKEELADVFNVIDHIEAIFAITDEEVAIEAKRKGERLARWVKNGDMELTTSDREVPTHWNDNVSTR